MNQEQEDDLYAQVAREVANGTYYPALIARAAVKADGNADRARSLYIKFRFEQLTREVKEEERIRQLESDRATREAKEEERQRQLESDRVKREQRRQLTNKAKAARDLKRLKHSESNQSVIILIIVVFVTIMMIASCWKQNFSP